MDNNTLDAIKPTTAEPEVVVREEIPATPEVEAARAEIETTRADIAETLGAIKEKLDPAALMDQAKARVEETASHLASQAKATVHDVVTDVADHAKETAGHAREAAKEAVTGAVTGAVDTAKDAVDSVVHTAKDAGNTVVDTIRRYPFPAALAAFGIAYLYMKNRDESHAASDRRSSAGYADVPSSENEEVGMVDQIKEKASEAAEAAKDAVGNTWEAAQGVGTSIVDTIQRNPVPAAAVALGAAWLFLKNQDENKAHRQDTSRYNDDYGYYSDETTGEYEGKTNGMADQVKEKMEQVKEKAGEMGETVSHALHTAKDRASEVTHQAKEKVEEFRSQAMEQARMAGDCFQRSLNDNPLPMGALALGIGAAIGLMIPETEREHKIMGKTRDRLVDQAQDRAQNLADRVKTVAEESLDAAKNTAKQEARNQGLASESEFADKGWNATEKSLDMAASAERQAADNPGWTPS